MLTMLNKHSKASTMTKLKKGDVVVVSKEEAADNTPAPPPKDFTQMIPPDLSDHARHVAEMLCLNATDKVNFNQVLKAAEKDIKAITNVDDYEIVKYLIEKIQAFL